MSALVKVGKEFLKFKDVEINTNFHSSKKKIITCSYNLDIVSNIRDSNI